MTTLLCEDSIDGIFTAIYLIWELKLNQDNVQVQLSSLHEFVLFSDYITVTTELEKSIKVARTIQRRFGADCYTSICQAALSNEPSKADAIYNTIKIGLSMASANNLIDHLSNPYINKVFECSRQTKNEAHHYLGFIRFSELDNGILFSKIRPKNNIITIISPHFEDRLPLENWVIYDEHRSIALLHKNQSVPILILDANFEENFTYSEEEFAYRDLFKTFFNSIAIKERHNTKLQNNLLPLRFRDQLTEFSY